jgi:GNAT superfamily N-acetyltransferase
VTDAPAIAELAGELGYAVEPAEIGRRLGSLDPGDEVWVGETGGLVVAWIHVGERRGLVSAPRAEILGLVVAEAYRGRGIGRLLVASAETWAAARGLGSVLVRSALHRDEAHAFYAKLGYRETKRQAVFVKDLEP